jgi:hypothetical protein
LISEDFGWQIFLLPDGLQFFHRIRRLMPNLRVLVLAMAMPRRSAVVLGKEDFHEDLIKLILACKKFAPFNIDYDLRDYCRFLISTVDSKVTELGIQLRFTHNLKSIMSINEPLTLYSIS